MVSKLTIAIIIINMKRMNTPIWMLLLQLSFRKDGYMEIIRKNLAMSKCLLLSQRLVGEKKEEYCMMVLLM